MSALYTILFVLSSENLDKITITGIVISIILAYYPKNKARYYPGF